MNRQQRETRQAALDACTDHTVAVSGFGNIEVDGASLIQLWFDPESGPMANATMDINEAEELIAVLVKRVAEAKVVKATEVQL